MKLTTIWTLRGMALSERFSRTWELFVQRLAFLLPKKIAYWSYIKSVNTHIKPDEVVPEVTAMEILERMSK